MVKTTCCGLKMNFHDLFCVILLSFITFLGVHAASTSKPHNHQGILEPYDGQPIRLELSEEQVKQLESGNAVLDKTRTGSSGRGLVIQDVQAPPEICMRKIVDVESYPNIVPYVRNVQIYEKNVFENGTTKVAAEFKLSTFGVSLRYFLKITHEARYNTLTWTLDYNRSSDFDDNVGHWQVISHPTKPGWSRILYSTNLKLFAWLPEFAVKIFTGKALVDSTAWVKRESEKEAKKNILDFKGGAIPNFRQKHSFSNSWISVLRFHSMTSRK